jgi:HAMP domain-containing protein
MIAGQQGPSADPKITVDEWGALLSGYAPIKASDGRTVGVLGIDMSGEQVMSTQAALRQWRIAILGIGICMTVIFGVRIAHWFFQPIGQLVQGTRRIGEGDLAYRVPIPSTDEVGALARAFNHMAQQLADSLQQLKDHVLATLQSLAAALEAKDVHTRGHSERVTFYAERLARHMGLPDEQIELIGQFSRLHDIGKIGIKEAILLKPAKLTAEEFDHIKRHPDLGYKILLPLKPPQLALHIVRHHHERQDGAGYPDRLKTDDIPLAVAIVTVADAFDGMTAFRPYRTQPMTFQEAVEELQRCSGTQFHPKAVEAMIDLLRADGKLS